MRVRQDDTVGDVQSLFDATRAGWDADLRTARKRAGGFSGSRVPASLPGRVGVSSEMLESVFDFAPGAMSVSALDGCWLAINDAYCRMLGYERAELLGGGYGVVTHPDDVAEDRTFVAAAVRGVTDVLEREKRYLRKDGSVLWALVRSRVIRSTSGEALYFVSHIQDSSERRATQHLLDDSERTLRSVLDNSPEIMCVKSRDHRYTLVNREFAQRLGVSSEWIVGRSDSDLVPPARLEDIRAKDLQVLDGAHVPAEEELVTLGGQERVVVRTRFPLRDETGKIHGICITLTDVTEHRLEEHRKRDRLQCSELIYSALAQDRFVLHGQPIVHLASSKPARFELLIRMRNVRGGKELLAPATFLPGAERFDLIASIDEWVIDQAIELAAAGHRVTVNVSAKTISDPDQVARIDAAVLASGGPAENLIFEITETALADNLEAARSFATQMRDRGCAIALDDFGVGHGSFTYLRHLPIDYLKIDMQFVRDLLRDDDDRQVVEAIIGVAHQYKIETIAEGVEDDATLHELRRLGVDYAQGYLLGGPAPLTQCWSPPRNRRRGDNATTVEDSPHAALVEGETPR
jgi:PAS domain S-box-containing protein